MSKFESIAWGLFAVTSTIAALFIPIHIIATEFLGVNMLGLGIFGKMLGNIAFKVYLFIIVSSAIYHGMYRFKSFLHDIGLAKYEKIFKNTLYFLGFLFPVLVVVALAI